ncbi:alpha-hydroxy acid oxidase [Teredinibacter turnerae]|uniref:alpha-hydroxy acid oxidase n=1 Tax=Teredinibacter turnerae TaxID=2426 RepID=UPI0005F82CCF|nr:alpha-hydroxy acid oxidase [Teredinibacter turnerae]
MAQHLTHIPPELASLADYEQFAEQFIDPVAWAYIQGGSGDERALQNNCNAFANYQCLPSLLRPCGEGTTEVRLFDTLLSHPIVLAPVAYQKLVHDLAEIETARAADATDSLMVSSTLASVPMEEVATHNTGTNWFQLYFQPDRDITQDLVARAEASGFSALMVTLDAPVQTFSRRLMRKGSGLPADITAANLLNYAQPRPVEIGQHESRVFQGVMRKAPILADLEWLINYSKLPVIVKGVLNPDDAERLLGCGVSGIVVSNHGGRAFAAAPAAIDCLSAIRERVGDACVLFDSGVRSGYDVFKALALGADAVMIGRPQVHALAIAGALGVAHMLQLLRDELEVAMAMAGCATIDEIKRVPVWKGDDYVNRN